MKIIAQDPAQTSQRVRVGMIGLAAVLLLIGLAAAIFSTASKERPFIVAGGAHPDVVANMAAGNNALPASTPTNEPLAELGVAPSTATEANAADSKSAKTPR
jgi:flagellar basal body-associated protein FliL